VTFTLEASFYAGESLDRIRASAEAQTSRPAARMTKLPLTSGTFSVIEGSVGRVR